MNTNNDRYNAKRIYIYTHTCERRTLDAKKIYSYFSRNNYTITNDPKQADYIIFLTCAYVNENIELCLNLIKKFQKYDAELIVAGCLPDIAGDRLREIFNGRIVTTKDIDKIDEIFRDIKIRFDDIEDEYSRWHNYSPINITKEPTELFRNTLKKSRLANRVYRFIGDSVLQKLVGNTVPLFNKLYPTNMEPYILEIARGCIHNCSYCAIIKAIGPLKSKPIEQCIKEFKFGLNNNFTEFVIEADDAGPYGIDIGTNLAELLEDITKIEGNYSIRLRNTHPAWIIKYISELEEILERKKIGFMLIPIQSGCNRILKRMRRSYTREAVIEAISKLKESYPELKIGTEVLVGFPSETRDEFGETLDLIEKTDVSKGKFTSFSPVKGTDANLMESKISAREKHMRMKIGLNFVKERGYYAWHRKTPDDILFQKSNTKPRQH